MSGPALASLRTRVAEHLDDPPVVEWALLTLHDIRGLGLTAETAALEEVWFGDAERVARWMAADEPGLHGRLLAELPPERFSAAVAALAERWPRWTGVDASRAGRVLATLAPECARKLFERALAEVPRPERSVRCAILEGAALLGPAGDGLFERALAQVPVGAEPPTFDWLASRLRAEPGRADASTVALVARWLRTGELGERLAELAEHLFGHAAFFALAVPVASVWKTVDLNRLAPLVTAETPLAAWHSLLAAGPDAALAELLPELEAKGANDPALAFAARLITALAAHLEDEEKALLAALAVAGLAHSRERPAPELASLSTGDLLDLLDLRLPKAPFHRELARCLFLKPRPEVLDLLTVPIALGRASGLSPRLLEALGSLEEPDLAPLFVEALGEDALDDSLEAATAALVRLGDVAVDAILRSWDDFDFCQRSQGFEVLTLVGGEDAISFVLARFEALAGTLEGQLDHSAVRLLDSRLLEPLAGLLDEEEPSSARPSSVLAALLGVEHPRAAEARALLQRSASQEEEQVPFGGFELDLIELPLRCTSCGLSADYACRLIFWTKDEDDTEPLVTDEFPCAGCGQITDLVPAPKTLPQLRAELEKAAETEAGGGAPPIRPERIELPDGRRVSLSTEIAALRRREAETPDHLPTLLERATAERAARRFQLASATYRRALTLDPAVIEAFWGLTHLHLDTGNHRRALLVLRQAIEHEAHWHFAGKPPITPGEFRHRVADLYEYLRQRLKATNIPPAPKSLTEKRAKVGRNDPCPCGSGKKWKRCCGG